MSRISANIGQIQKLATSLDGLSQQVETLRTALDAAVRPALRPDVPEAGAITSQASFAGIALTGLAGSIAGRSGMVRGYATSMARVEAMLAIYRYQLKIEGLSRLGWHAPGARADSVLQGPAADELRTDLLNVALGYGIERLPGLPRLADGTLDLAKGVGFLAAKGIVVKGAWNVWSMGSALGTIYDPKSDGLTRFGAGLEFGAGLTGSGAVALEILGFGGSAGHAALVGGARFLGPAAAGYTIGHGIGTYKRQQLEADDAAGVSSLERINMTTMQRQQQLGRFGLAGNAVVAGEAGLNYGTLGVYRGSQAIARQIWPDTPQPDEIDANRQAQLLAAVREIHPDAQVVPLDGKFIVKVPNGAAVDSFFVGNTKLTIR